MMTRAGIVGYRGAVVLATVLGAVPLVMSCTRTDDTPLPRQDAATTTATESASRPSGPPKRIYAKRFVVPVRSLPSKEGARLGYLRAGVVVQARTAEPVGYDGCKEGWFELQTRGFVCAGRDVIPFDGRKLPEMPPAQPNFDAALPYTFAHTKKSRTPMYRRLPTLEEVALYENPPIGSDLAAAEMPTTEQMVPDAGTASAAESVRAVPDPPSSPPPPGSAINDSATLLDAGAPAVPTLDSLKGERGTVLIRYLERGFLLSLDREMKGPAGKYWRTMSSGYVPASRLFMISGSSMSGLQATSDVTAPALRVGVVMASVATALQWVGPENRKRLRKVETLRLHQAVRVVGQEQVRNRAYWVTEQGWRVAAGDLRVTAVTAPSADLQPNEKWIDVDKATQTLVAYEGARPVFATIVSTGKIKDENDPLQNHDTPAGSFRINSKYVTHTMDGDHAVDGPYSIEDVPYVMYFQLAYALHSAFWHDRFGRPRSHGCINMAPRDAKWLFQWSAPAMPEGWHAVYPTDTEPGTRVVIRGETPKR
jgi:lipoprotein-anchoring transpeptidase ErfK/SrfK